MKQWRKKFQAYWMTLDIKPFGKWKRAVEGSERMKARDEARRHMKLSKVLDDNEDR